MLKYLIVAFCLVLMACENKKAENDPKKTVKKVFDKKTIKVLESSLVKGKLKFFDGKYQEALKVFLDIAKTEEQYAETYTWIARCYEKMNNPEKSIANYSKALELDEEQNFSRQKLAVVAVSDFDMEKAKKLAEESLEFEDNKAIPNAVLAAYYLYYKEIPKAKDYMAKAIAIDKSNPFINYLKGCLEFLAGNLDSAELYLQNSLKDPFLKGNAALFLSKVYYHKKDYQRAENLLKEITSKQTVYNAEFALAELYFRTRQFRQAYELLMNVMLSRAKTPNSIRNQKRYVERIAALLLQYKDYDRALTIASEHSKYHPQSDVLHLIAARIYLQKGLFSQAEEHAKAVLNFTKQLKLQIRVNEFLGRLYSIQGRYQEALSHFLFIKDKTPKIKFGHLLCGKTYSRLKLEDFAIKLYVSALKIFPEDREIRYSLMESYINQKQWNKAYLIAKKLEKELPKSNTIKTHLAIILEQLGKKDEAMLYYQKITGAGALSGVAANNIAMILIKNNKKDLSYAKKLAVIAVQKTQHPLSYDTLGWIYLLQKDYTNAAKLLEKALQKMPDHPGILYHNGVLQMEKGNHKEAHELLQKMLQSPDESPYISDAKKRLEILKNK